MQVMRYVTSIITNLGIQTIFSSPLLKGGYMEKVITIVVVLIVMAINVAGCASTPKELPKVQETSWANELSKAPKWVLNPSDEGGLAAKGSAKIGVAGIQFATDEAMANARDAIAQIMSIKVQIMMDNFKKTSGIGVNEALDKVTNKVSRQVSYETIVGSKQKDVWISPSGELYVLATVDPNMAKESVKNAIQSSLRNEEALWQQFQAKKAFEELEKEIEREFGAEKKQAQQ